MFLEQWPFCHGCCKNAKPKVASLSLRCSSELSPSLLANFLALTQTDGSSKGLDDSFFQGSSFSRAPLSPAGPGHAGAHFKGPTCPKARGVSQSYACVYVTGARSVFFKSRTRRGLRPPHHGCTSVMRGNFILDVFTNDKKDDVLQASTSSGCS